jgi:hypothetical protein
LDIHELFKSLEIAKLGGVFLDNAGGGIAQLEAHRRVVGAFGGDLVLVLGGARVVRLGVDDHRHRQLDRTERARVGAERNTLGLARDVVGQIVRELMRGSGRGRDGVLNINNQKIV